MERKLLFGTNTIFENMKKELLKLYSERSNREKNKNKHSFRKKDRKV